jgi:hypothetical protein
MSISISDGSWKLEAVPNHLVSQQVLPRHSLKFKLGVLWKIHSSQKEVAAKGHCSKKLSREQKDRTLRCDSMNPR